MLKRLLVTTLALCVFALSGKASAATGIPGESPSPRPARPGAPAYSAPPAAGGAVAATSASPPAERARCSSARRRLEVDARSTTASS